MTPRNNMSFDGYTWENDEFDPMVVIIKQQGQPLMRFFIGEAMEGAGRARVMAHVRECDNSPWMTEWIEHAEKDMLDKLSK
jgi:hypothetical protein